MICLLFYSEYCTCSDSSIPESIITFPIPILRLFLSVHQVHHASINTVFGLHRSYVCIVWTDGGFACTLLFGSTEENITVTEKQKCILFQWLNFTNRCLSTNFDEKRSTRELLSMIPFDKIFWQNHVKIPPWS